MWGWESIGKQPPAAGGIDQDKGSRSAAQATDEQNMPGRGCLPSGRAKLSVSCPMRESPPITPERKHKVHVVREQCHN